MSAKPSSDTRHCGGEPDETPGAASPPITRRSFLGAVTAMGVVASAGGLTGLIRAEDAEAADTGPVTGAERADQALNVRVAAARLERDQPLPDHPNNGDEARYANKIASFSKALPHNALGEVDLAAYGTLIRALTTGKPGGFEAIAMGGDVMLVDPQAALAFDLVGPDSHQLAIPPAPTFSSAWQAAEMGEIYWQALSRDVPFSQYATNPITREAARDLSQFSDYRGPKSGGRVTTRTLFRGGSPGDLVGPYISQFLWADVPFGARPFDQRIRTTVPNVDFLTEYDEWLANQNGAMPAAKETFDPVLRFIHTGRDLSEWVHRDFPFLAPMNAALILLGVGASFDQDSLVLPGSRVVPPSGVPLDQNNPYVHSRTQTGFATLGVADILGLVASVTVRALKAAWCQKWLVHRRLRPEEFGGRLHNNVMGGKHYPIHDDIIKSSALGMVFRMHCSYLLPQAYPEGAPAHPAYPSGHAAFLGASCTVLKAFFDESFVIPNPVVASDDGTSLEPYDGPSLTVGNELNKLAANIALGRGFAGIHYRTCVTEGLKLGEAVAIRVLMETKLTYNESFPGFTLTKFDGSTVTVGGSMPPLEVHATVSAQGGARVVGISITNYSVGDIGYLEIRGTIPPGGSLVAAAPTHFEMQGNEVVWFNATVLGQGQTRSGFQYTYADGSGNPAVTVSFMGKTRGTVSTGPLATGGI